MWQRRLKSGKTAKTESTAIQGAVFPEILFQISLDGVGKPCYTVTSMKKGWAFLMKKQTIDMNSAFYFAYYYFINSKRIK